MQGSNGKRATAAKVLQTNNITNDINNNILLSNNIIIDNKATTETNTIKRRK